MAAKPPSVVRALASATRAAQPGPADQATVALARHYAALIDQAAVLAAAADRRLEERRAAGEDDGAELLARLRAEVDARAVASDVGPKLLAALAALKMTPAARSAVVNGGESPGVRDAARTALAQLREQRRPR